MLGGSRELNRKGTERTQREPREDLMMRICVCERMRAEVPNWPCSYLRLIGPCYVISTHVYCGPCIPGDSLVRQGKRWAYGEFTERPWEALNAAVMGNRSISIL